MLRNKQRPNEKSTTCKRPKLIESPSTLDKPPNPVYEMALLRFLGDLPKLTGKQIVLRLCQMRGPWTTRQMQAFCHKYKRDIPLSTLQSSARDLKAFELIEYVNGGYAIKGWDNE